MIRTRLALTGALLAGCLASAGAQELKFPRTLVWTAYETGSSSYTQAVAIGNVLKNNYGTSVRILPGKNDISRAIPLRAGKAEFCACGIGSYFAQEGVFDFAQSGWGPQPYRVLLSNLGTNGLGVATAADANIETPKDFKGKRVASVLAAPALNIGVEAFLAFGGYGWDDVQKVEFSGFAQAIDGLIANQVDAAFMSTVTPQTEQIAASPRDIRWPRLDHDDEAAWQRFLDVAPYFQKHLVTTGGGINKEKPWEGATYPFPILIAYPDQDTELVYSLLKVMHQHFDEYKDAAPGGEGWSLDTQNFQWVMPFHEGAIRYFKEAGKWSDELQAHNDQLVKRQEVLVKAWEPFKDKDLSDESVQAEWLKARAAALEKADLKVGLKGE